MSNCPNCGTPLKPGALFCGQCGTDVREVNTASEQSPPTGSQSPNTAVGDSINKVINTASQISFTHSVNDFIQLGGLALVFISLWLPWVGLPGGIDVGIGQAGIIVWLLVLIILIDGGFVAVPDWRKIPRWSSVQKFLSAAALGSILTVIFSLSIIRTVVSSYIERMLNNSGGGFGLGSLLGSIHVGSSLITLQVGLVFAVIGIVGVVVGAWRVRQ